MLSLRRKFVSDTITYGLAQGLIALRELLVLPLFARFMSAEQYGLFTQLLVTTSLLLPIVTFRLLISTVRFLSPEDDRASFRRSFYSGLTWVFGAGIIVGILLALFAAGGAQLILGDAAYAEFMPMTSLLILSSVAVAYIQNYYRIVRRIKTMAVILLLQTAFEVVLIILAIYLGYGVKGAVWALVIVRISLSVILLAVVRARIGPFGFDGRALRELLAYGIPLMPNGAMMWAVNYFDRIIIVHFLGLTALGIYSASYSLAMGLKLLFSPVGFVLLPVLSRLWDKGEAEEVKRYFTYTNRYFLLLGLPASFGLAWMSQPLLTVIASSQFTTNTFLVLWIALGILFEGVFQINVYVYHLLRQTKYVSLVLLLSTAVNIVLNVVLVPLIGLVGSAFATALTFGLMASLVLYHGRQRIHYRVQWADAGKGVLASGCMAAVLYWIPQDTLWGIVTGVTVGLFIYFLVLVLLRTFTKAEAAHVRRLILSYLPLENPQ